MIPNPLSRWLSPLPLVAMPRADGLKRFPAKQLPPAAQKAWRALPAR